MNASVKEWKYSSNLNSLLSGQLPFTCVQIRFLVRMKLCTSSTQPHDRKSEDASEAILKHLSITHIDEKAESA